MPLVRKIIEIGKTSKGIILPKSWLDFLEAKHGKVEAVTMEVDGQLTIKPILKEEVDHAAK
jgi:antitoxin component of MazEF toxin-antitoxin module